MAMSMLISTMIMHDDHARTVRSKHEFADELRQIVAFVDPEDVDRRQSIHGEVQRLNDLEQAAQMHSNTSRRL